MTTTGRRCRKCRRAMGNAGGWRNVPDDANDSTVSLCQACYGEWRLLAPGDRQGFIPDSVDNLREEVDEANESGLDRFNA